MKVKIKKYPTWWGPYQAIKTIFFWTKFEDEYGLPEYPEWVDNLAERYSNTWIGKLHIALAEAYMSWKTKNRIKIKIDRWDSWNVDDTLAHIALPLLKQLKKEKHGAPYVYPTDVPTDLRPTKKQIDDYSKKGETDPMFFERWNWVLDEIIWAFEQHTDSDAEDQFFSGEHDVLWTKVDANGNEVSEDYDGYFLYRMDRGPDDTSKFDKEGYDAWLERKRNGFALFGKYYTALWD